MSKKELVQAVKIIYPLHLVESTIHGIEHCEAELARTAKIVEVFGNLKDLLLEGKDNMQLCELTKMQTLRIAVHIVNTAA